MNSCYNFIDSLNIVSFDVQIHLNSRISMDMSSKVFKLLSNRVLTALMMEKEILLLAIFLFLNGHFPSHSMLFKEHSFQIDCILIFIQ